MIRTVCNECGGVRWFAPWEKVPYKWLGCPRCGSRDVEVEDKPIKV